MNSATQAIRVRWTHPDDWAQLAHIERSAFGQDALPDADLQSVYSPAYIAYRNSLLLVAEDTECHRLLGYVLVCIWPQCTEVIRMAVLPAAQRQGVGRTLLARLRDECPDKSLIADVPEERLIAQLFFRNFGLRAGAHSICRDRFGAGNAYRMILDPPEQSGAVA